MGAHGDWIELKQAWKQYSGLAKIIFVLMFFLSVSSISSLAQYVADWKWFFLDGVEFYQEELRNPLSAWLMNHTSARFGEGEGDLLVLGCLMFLPSTIDSFKNLLKAKSRSFVSLWLALTIGSVLLLGLLFFLMGWGYKYSNNYEGPGAGLYITYIGYYLYGIKTAFESDNQFMKLSMIGPPVAVVICAAVNKGLTMGVT